MRTGEASTNSSEAAAVQPPCRWAPGPCVAGDLGGGRSAGRILVAARWRSSGRGAADGDGETERTADLDRHHRGLMGTRTPNIDRIGRGRGPGQTETPARAASAEPRRR